MFFVVQHRSFMSNNQQHQSTQWFK